MRRFPLHLIIFILLAAAPRPARAQHGYNFSARADRAVFPGWVDSLMRRQLLGNLRWEAWLRYSPAQRDTLLAGLAIADEKYPRQSSIPKRFSVNESLTLLAWSAVGPSRATLRGAHLDLGLADIDTANDEITLPSRKFNLLYLVRFDDAERRARWGLVVGSMVIDDEGEYNIAYPRLAVLLDSAWMARAAEAEREARERAVAERKAYKREEAERKTREHDEGASDRPAATLRLRVDRRPSIRLETMSRQGGGVLIDPSPERLELEMNDTAGLDPRARLFEHAPTSAEIYRFLDTLSMRTGGQTRSARDFFDPAALVAGSPHASFTGGEVDQRAWREATGAAPLLRFPEGR
jgi:hypothetical protein